MRVIDGDSHIYEPRNMWVDYSPAADRDLALRIEEDPLGYSWFVLRGEVIGKPAWVSGPDNWPPSNLGAGSQHWLAGKKNPQLNYTELPEEWWNAAARVKKLDEWEIDEAFVFNQGGFQWEDILHSDVKTSQVNMAAWNRWTVELAADGGGRLHPVGHVRIDLDTRWLEEQLQILSRGGVRFAMLTPLLVEGRRLSHPDLDAVWRLFVDYGVTPTFHVGENSMRSFKGFEPDHLNEQPLGWCDNDHAFIKLIPSVYVLFGYEIALMDLAVNGVFERHPSLRFLIAELGGEWFPQLAMKADYMWKIYEAATGAAFSALPRPAGDYLLERATVVCSSPSDIKPGLVEDFPGLFAYGGDYPHPEGLNDPFNKYRARLGELTPADNSGFFGDNIATLLT